MFRNKYFGYCAEPLNPILSDSIGPVITLAAKSLDYALSITSPTI